MAVMERKIFQMHLTLVLQTPSLRYTYEEQHKKTQ